MIPHREIAAAKLNLALHVRGKRDDGRHDIETLFVFCADGDRLSAEAASELKLEASGPFASALPPAEDNLVFRAATLLQARSGTTEGAHIVLQKLLPVASGIGGGSADAAAALRVLTTLWDIDPVHASAVAPELGSDVPACLLSLPAKGQGAGDELTPLTLPELSGQPVLLVNPRVELATAAVFGAHDGSDGGPLGDWRDGGNDLQEAAKALVPQIGTVLAWLAAQPGAGVVRMSGSGATCFALFESDEERDRAAEAVPREWWYLATSLR